MNVVGNEIGQKMRSAIKAKLTELGCYVDDELPDYVMVMVANKRTRSQMEDDLQLFLGDNTVLFVNWLHQVLKKLQEVTVTTPLIVDTDKHKERSKSKDPKTKEKKVKDKSKKGDLKKAKKKDKVKLHRKSDEKKAHKSKKKNKVHEMIRPNVPPLLMNMEKESEPSITDVFAGQILKNHGITIDVLKDDPKEVKETKLIEKEIKRPILPIIDPATISSQPETENIETTDLTQDNTSDISVSSPGAPKEDQAKEIHKIEAKIEGLKHKLTEELDSISDDEDFLTIRTEADDLMNDFVEDVYQEISQPAPSVVTPPLQRSPTPPAHPVSKPIDVLPEPTIEPETLPQIELNLPKRPIRERLGVRQDIKKVPETKEKENVTRTESPERFTPEREPEFRPHSKSAKSRLGDPLEPPRKYSGSDNSICDKPDNSSSKKLNSKLTPEKEPESRPHSKSIKSRLGEPLEPQRKHSVSDESVCDKTDNHSNKRLNSKVSVLENRPSRSSCTSVVRVRPRPRVSAPASNLLMKAVADAHKSLLNTPAKIETESHKVKRALVLPMRRCVEAEKIVIQVPAGDNLQTETGDSISLGDMDSDDDKNFKLTSDTQSDKYVPPSITKKIINDEYTPLRQREERTSKRKDDTLIIETINIHNPSIGKDKNTQFIVTMDGFSPNAFLAKKLLTEGLLNEDDEIKKNENKSNLSAQKETVTKEIVHEHTKSSENIKSVQNESVNTTVQKVSENTKSNLKVSENTKSDQNLSKNTKSTRKELEKTKSVQKEPPQITEKKRLSNTSEESDTQVIIKKELEDNVENVEMVELITENSPPARKRKASPIVFDVEKKGNNVERKRERTESASSDNHVIVTTVTNTHKYDSVPPLSAAERKMVWCRAFPLCRYGNACAFAHPRCKFAAACTRRSCPYSHALNALTPPVATVPPSVASQVIPATSFKSISSSVPLNLCKFYPSCVNPLCHYYHPKRCRYGKACANKQACNFYHSDTPLTKWRYPV